MVDFIHAIWKKTSCGFICPEPGKCLNHRQGVKGSFGRPFCQKLHHTFVLLTARILRALRPIIKILIKWIKIIEGYHAKRVYIGFWPIFIFLQDELIFQKMTCFDMKRIVPQLSWSICASSSRNNVCKKLSFPLETFSSTKNKRNLLFCLLLLFV